MVCPEATLEKFIAKGFIHDFGDIFEIAKYRDEIVEMDGFGEKSFDNLMVSIEKAKETVPAKVLYSLGIANIGLSNAKVICRHFEGDLAQDPECKGRGSRCDRWHWSCNCEKSYKVFLKTRIITADWIICSDIFILIKKKSQRIRLCWNEFLLSQEVWSISATVEKPRI